MGTLLPLQGEAGPVISSLSLTRALEALINEDDRNDAVLVLGLAFKRTSSFSGGTEPPCQKLNHTAGETPLER